MSVCISNLNEVLWGQHHRKPEPGLTCCPPGCWVLVDGGEELGRLKQGHEEQQCCLSFISAGLAGEIFEQTLSKQHYFILLYAHPHIYKYI